MLPQFKNNNVHNFPKIISVAQLISENSSFLRSLEGDMVTQKKGIYEGAYDPDVVPEIVTQFVATLNADGAAKALGLLTSLEQSSIVGAYIERAWSDRHKYNLYEALIKFVQEKPAVAAMLSPYSYSRIGVRNCPQEVYEFYAQGLNAPLDHCFRTPVEGDVRFSEDSNIQVAYDHSAQPVTVCGEVVDRTMQYERSIRAGPAVFLKDMGVFNFLEKEYAEKYKCLSEYKSGPVNKLIFFPSGLMKYVPGDFMSEKEVWGAIYMRRLAMSAVIVDDPTTAVNLHGPYRLALCHKKFAPPLAAPDLPVEKAFYSFCFKSSTIGKFKEDPNKFCEALDSCSKEPNPIVGFKNWVKGKKTMSSSKENKYVVPAKREVIEEEYTGPVPFHYSVDLEELIVPQKSVSSSSIKREEDTKEVEKKKSEVLVLDDLDDLDEFMTEDKIDLSTIDPIYAGSVMFPSKDSGRDILAGVIASKSIEMKHFLKSEMLTRNFSKKLVTIYIEKKAKCKFFEAKLGHIPRSVKLMTEWNTRTVYYGKGPDGTTGRNALTHFKMATFCKGVVGNGSIYRTLKDLQQTYGQYQTKVLILHSDMLYLYGEFGFVRKGKLNSSATSSIYDRLLSDGIAIVPFGDFFFAALMKGVDTKGFIHCRLLVASDDLETVAVAAFNVTVYDENGRAGNRVPSRVEKIMAAVELVKQGGLPRF